MLTPPVSEKRPTERVHHGDVVIDDYEWLREKDDPAVIAHLHQENAYTKARTEHLTLLQEQLFEEIKGRTKETDLSVPTREGDPSGDPVLKPLDRAPVVPPAAVPHRHAEVGLLGAGADLLDDPVRERLHVAGAVGGVAVLGLEVGGQPRVVAVGHPRVVVDHGVPVNRSGRRFSWSPG